MWREKGSFGPQSNQVLQCCKVSLSARYPQIRAAPRVGFENLVGGEVTKELVHLSGLKLELN